jgi:hypothetical protein
VTISARPFGNVHYDPYDVDLNSDPYPMFNRLREEQPLYYNEEHNFYAHSVRRGAGTARGPDRSGGDPQTVPRMGCRHGQCVALADLHCSRLGLDASRPSMNPFLQEENWGS